MSRYGCRFFSHIASLTTIFPNQISYQKLELMKAPEKITNPKFGKRHILAIWLFTGFVNCYILRVSLNVAIVSMVNGTSVTNAKSDLVSGGSDICPFPIKDNATYILSEEEGDFNWDHATQGVILSSFYYGYICTQFIGGYLVRIFGARLMFGIGVGGTAALTLLNPIAARTNPSLLIALRVIEGLLEGIAFPSAHQLLSAWAPTKERSLLVVFPISGANVGTILAAPLTGFLCEYGFDGGWASSFYVFGAFSLLWCIGWFYYVHDTPAKHPTIRREEREYIEAHCKSSSKPLPFRQMPWRAIALSPAVWAIVFAHTSFNWNFYTLLTEMSTYLKDVLHISSSMNGIVTSIPYICLWLMQLFGAFLADVLRAKGAKTKTVRKLAYGSGMFISAAILVIIHYVGCNLVAVIFLLCCSCGISGVAASGYIVNHVDIAPQYSGILMGITNTFATLPGILSPLLAGAITNVDSTNSTWQIIFYISAGVSAFGAVIFLLFAEGEVQKWALVDEEGEEKGRFITHGNGTDESAAIIDADVVIRQR